MTKTEKIEEIVKGIEENTDFEVMKEMKSILNKTFGENNNQILKPNYFSAKRIAYEDSNLSGFLASARDMTVDELTGYMKMIMNHSLYYQIIIKFPEINITNGTHNHIINDLYVRAFIRPNGTIRNGIDGIRGKLSIEEVRSSYAHSHLPYNNPRDSIFQPFCTGIGPINQVMMLLNTKYTAVNFKMFLFHLKVFVAWESLEGRPHMYIENIGKGNTQDYYYLGDSSALEISRHMIRRMKDVPIEELLSYFKYDVSSTKINVKINEKFEKWACELMRSWDMNNMWPGYGIEWNCLFNTRDTSGRYYPIPRSGVSQGLYDGEKVLLQFKGEDIKLQVNNPEILDSETIKDEEKVPHELIAKYIGKELSRNLSETAFGNARIRLCSAGADKSKVTGSNPIHVQTGME